MELTSGWAELKTIQLGPDSWKLTGFSDGRARCLTLIRRSDGSWRVLEAGRVEKILPPGRLDPDAAEAADAQELAPMEGVVTRVAVSAGEIVAAGAPLYVLEAMKMQMQVSASIPGRIVAVCVAPGERVRARQQVLRFEALE